MDARNMLEPYRDRLEEYRNTPPEQLLRDNMYGLLALAVTVFAFWIRALPAHGMKYIQALDPYMESRMAQAIATLGHLPPIDVWRYVPFAMPTYQIYHGNVYVPAFMYMVLHPLTGVTFLSWAQIYPAIMGAGMVLVMYFIGKETFDRKSGLFAALFLAASPAVLHRSSAGWFEKEPISTFLMFTSIYFVIRAWKRKSWASSILAGITLAVSMTAWGGTKFLFLLYPLVLFTVAFIDEDIENLIIAFTPTILLGHLLAFVLDPPRWMLPNGIFLAGIGVLGVVWIRYLTAEYDVVKEAHYKYVVPGLSVLGGVLLFLSPLYSNRLGHMVMSVIASASQSTGGIDVVSGTVAENTPSSAGQIIGQLGVAQITTLPQLQSFYPLAEFFSGWTFSILGASALIAIGGYMLLRKYEVIDKVSSGTAYFGFIMTTLAFSAVIMVLLPGNSTQTLLAFAYPMAWAIIGGLFLYVFSTKEKVSIGQHWYIVLPLFWILATMYGATQKSRLLFLTSNPVALLAGFGLSLAVTELQQSTVWEKIAERSEELDSRRVAGVVIALLLIPVLIFNGGAAYAMAHQIGGSPNQYWMQNLNYMRNNTPVDSVILSWWDYGYWFQTIGGRASIADGGNSGFYAHALKGNRKINYPLADFLAGSDYKKYMGWMKNLSVDYVVLDSSMIGKYSAVSQIHNRNNNKFSAMQTMRCAQQNGHCVIQRSQSNGKQYLIYGARNTRILVPVKQNGNGVQLDGTPLLQQGSGTAPIRNFCSAHNGIISFNINSSQQSVPGCIAWHPYYRQTKIIYIPQDVMHSTLVRLYVMNAYNMPEFKLVNDVHGFVKMWKVNYTTQNQ